MNCTLSSEEIEEIKEIKEKCKLEFGRTIIHDEFKKAKFKVAEKRAFTIKREDCEITYINKNGKKNREN